MKRWLMRGLVGLILLTLCVSTAVYWYLQTDAFRERLRQTIISEVQRVSGGRAELQSAAFTFPGMKATLRGFTLHGKEPAGEAPLFTARQIDVELHVTSWFRQMADVHSVILTGPRIRIVSDAQGNTNLPEPPQTQRTEKRDFIDTLLDIKAQRFEIVDGALTINDDRVPLDLKTEQLALALRYDRRGPKYTGHLRAAGMDVKALRLNPLKVDLDADTELEHGKVNISAAKLRVGASEADIVGFAYDLMRPSANFNLTARLAMPDVAKLIALPVGPVGTANFKGKVTLGLQEKFRYLLEGSLDGAGLTYTSRLLEVRNGKLRGDLLASNDGLKVTGLRIDALGGSLIGTLETPKFENYKLEGDLKDLATNQLHLLDKPLPLAAMATGKVRLEGKLGPATIAAAAANLTLSPMATGRPLRGMLNLTYAGGGIEATNSYLSTPDTEVTFHGALNSNLRVGARTANLADVQPFLSTPLPVTLRQGFVSFDGTVAGTVDDARVAGRVQAANVEYQGRLLERASADLTASKTQVRARNLSVQEQAMQLTGSGSVALRDWQVEQTSALEASLALKGAKIDTLLRTLQIPDPGKTSGTLNASANLRGTLAAPQGDGTVRATNIVAYREPIDSISANVKFTPDVVEAANGEMVLHKATVPFSLRYAKSGADWKSGVLRWKAQSSGIDIGAINHLHARMKDFSGTLAFSTDGEGQVASGDLRLRFLNGELRVPSLGYKQTRVGSVELRAATKGSVMGVTGRSVFQGARVRLNGEWNLQGNAPGEGSLSIAGGSFENLIAMLSSEQRPMPFQSALEGDVRFQVALLDPEDTFRANVVLRRIQINPDPQQILRGGAREQDLVITNLQPVRVQLTANEAVVQSAQFAGTKTRVSVTGKAAFHQTSAWDLKVAGTVDMAELQLVNKDLLSAGTARMDAAVRGPLDNPQINGQLYLENASLYFGDLPTGIDNVNGSVLFDRSRATVQTLAGESGGGKFSLTGFVGFGGPALVYRLQAVATGVRVRYPEGASTTVNANLSLTGTSEDSLLAGNVSLVRAGFNPRTDFASMLAETAGANQPTEPVAASNEYLRGMQFDLRIESAPNLEFQTSLTRGLRAEVDLRLRGNLLRPSLLGNVSFSEGEISLFGNKYTLNRGDVRFFNPTRIEPTFDLEAETRARGITVNVSFSGTPRKINAAYRSDPPLQPSEIIALLAIGRDPNIGAGLATSQSNNQSTLQGVGSLVGEAVASSLNGRLQKFFGVSRIKIDPQLTGVENIPQARLTLEQQVSKDITLTYITNLARTQEQIVRIQWDISRQWSATAIREENGLFGIDFQFRKRFK
ncbi:hypothetical protein F183_A25130 [Bryobacterales bacterium F-183]|nr:hypothetical protein F183_A25130 [Bryobacterales bacterium F-183]